MKPKIAIIVTTFFRDKLLDKCIQAMLVNLPENAIILIGDQGNNQDINKLCKYTEPPCFYYQLPLDCGLSYARNYLVEEAYKFGYEYCVIASDSMIFNENTKDIDLLIPRMLNNYDLIGCHLNGTQIYWVGWLSLIAGEAFKLTFIDRSDSKEQLTKIYPCSCVPNFFIATTESLLKVKWDNTLKLAEHEDFFYRYNQEGYKCGWTLGISCDYIREHTNELGKYRTKNWEEGLKTLYKKYSIKSWIRYENIENGRYGVK